jgi:hypothetical protein
MTEPAILLNYGSLNFEANKTLIKILKKKKKNSRQKMNMGGIHPKGTIVLSDYF